ncbi:acidic fibroblast growth factor intracellular binding [Schistosoma japonicum]|nr:acidic fibroblast growth factor intracellular binding [Schistosoma japonicum]
MIFLFVLNIFISHLIIVNYSLEYFQKSNLFCTDSMLEKGFTHIILNSTLPLFGKNKWFSIENLTNFTKLHKLKNIHSHECFNKTIERFDDCWNSIRKKWIEYLIPIENINDRLIIEEIEQNRSNKTSRIVNDTIYFQFLNALCLSACYSRYKENLKPTIKSHILCPFPCILQNDCSYELCKNYGVFTHEYECPCNDSNKWDRDSNECIPKSIYKIRQTREYPDFIAKEKMLRQRKMRNCEHNSMCNKNGTLFCTLDSNYEAKCVCDPGYDGIACDEWVGEWSEWSEWNKCRPDCGNIRFSLRKRECLSIRLGNKSKQCLGSSIEYAKCLENICKFLDTSSTVKHL